MTPEYRYTFTVFTPTFNRAHTLQRVYESLTRQTFRDFEWLIVDDGSKDGTESLVSGWLGEADFPIRYVWQENAGKPSATNRGALLADGQLFLVLDSDDVCVPNALERFKYHWETIPRSKRSRFVGVTGLTQRPDGTLDGTPFPGSPFDSTALEIRNHKLRGEKWGFVRTTVLREFPYPIIPGEPYIPEGIVWNRMARAYQTRYVNEVLRIYYPTEDSLSSTLAQLQCPKGAVQYYREFISFSDSLPHAVRLRACANRVRYGLHVGQELRRQRQDLPSVGYWLAALAVGLPLYLRDRNLVRRRRRQED